MNKKADGMTLNVIVVAALALIVLVVLTAIFAGKIKDSSEKGETSTTETLNKLCSQQKTPSECKSENTCGAGKGVYIDCATGYCCPRSG